MEFSGLIWRLIYNGSHSGVGSVRIFLRSFTWAESCISIWRCESIWSYSRGSVNKYQYLYFELQIVITYFHNMFTTFEKCNRALKWHSKNSWNNLSAQKNTVTLGVDAPSEFTTDTKLLALYSNRCARGFKLPGWQWWTFLHDFNQLGKKTDTTDLKMDAIENQRKLGGI